MSRSPDAADAPTTTAPQAAEETRVDQSETSAQAVDAAPGTTPAAPPSEALNRPNSKASQGLSQRSLFV